MARLSSATSLILALVIFTSGTSFYHYFFSLIMFIQHDGGQSIWVMHKKLSRILHIAPLLKKKLLNMSKLHYKFDFCFAEISKGKGNENATCWEDMLFVIGGGCPDLNECKETCRP